MRRPYGTKGDHESEVRRLKLIDRVEDVRLSCPVPPGLRDARERSDSLDPQLRRTTYVRRHAEVGPSRLPRTLWLDLHCLVRIERSEQPVHVELPPRAKVLSPIRAPKPC